MQINQPCKIVSNDLSSLKEAALRIHQSKLVAFPTETVYGLGANALDAKACSAIYSMKKRPTTDPLIVHVAEKTKAYELIDPSPEQKIVFEKLADKFWPGPLTMIVKASKLIPKEVTSGTGFVGIRFPAHETAREFIKVCGVPLAAPSANLFNHVSPTTAAHVFDDFHDQDLQIIDDGSATLGIESTVVKLNDGELNFLRLGSLPKKEIEDYLKSDETLKHIKTTYVQKKKQEDQTCISPGQFVKHYSPLIKTVILSSKRNVKTKIEQSELANCVLIDFGNFYNDLEDKVLKRINLSEKGVLKEAMYKLYFSLRVGEEIKNAKLILVCDIAEAKDRCDGEDQKYFDSIYDKIYRASSGEYVTLNTN